MPVDRRLFPPEVSAPSPYLDPLGDGEAGYIGSGLLASPTRVPLEQSAEWALDGGAYLLKFSTAHGDKPVQVDDWLVWEDGWRLDAYDPMGTELPPLQGDGLKSLLIAYYQRRIEVVNGLYWAIWNRVDALESLQRAKTLPLQMQSVTITERKTESGSREFIPEVSTEAIDLLPAKRAMEDLQKDLDYCRGKLANLATDVPDHTRRTTHGQVTREERSDELGTTRGGVGE